MENNEKIELTQDMLEDITGGTLRTINTGGGSKAQIRTSPTTGADNRLSSLANGTQVETISDDLIWDDVSQRHFVMISFVNKKGKRMTGYVASSLVGLPR